MNFIKNKIIGNYSYILLLNRDDVKYMMEMAIDNGKDGIFDKFSEEERFIVEQHGGLGAYSWLIDEAKSIFYYLIEKIDPQIADLLSKDPDYYLEP